MLEAVNALRDVLVAVVREAWSFSADDLVYWGTPRKPIDAYPHAVISLESVSREFTGVRVVEESYEIVVEGKFPVVPAASLDDLKVQRAQELGEALTPAPTNFASPAEIADGVYLPIVTSVDFSGDEDADPFYSLRVSLQARARVYQ